MAASLGRRITKRVAARRSICMPSRKLHDGGRGLKGHSGIWRIRVGSYRVGYQVDENVLLVLVVTVSTRDKVHDALRRDLGR